MSQITTFAVIIVFRFSHPPKCERLIFVCKFAHTVHMYLCTYIHMYIYTRLYTNKPLCQASETKLTVIRVEKQT